MFDFRYHALSLAAVFIALAVGLLLGVAIGDANLVSNAEKRLRNVAAQRPQQRARNDAAQVRAQLGLPLGLRARHLSPARGRRAAGKRIGLMFLGQPSNQLSGLVRAALEPTGGADRPRRGDPRPGERRGSGAARPATRYAGSSATRA